MHVHVLCEFVLLPPQNNQTSNLSLLCLPGFVLGAGAMIHETMVGRADYFNTFQPAVLNQQNNMTFLSCYKNPEIPQAYSEDVLKNRS